MKSPIAVCLMILGLAPAIVCGGDLPTTIEEFYDTGGTTRCIAHRGFSGAAPENTLAAVRAAIDIGADMAEVDVSLSADRRIVVMHDDTIDRTTNGSGEVVRFTLAELRELDAGSWFDPGFSDERIPTLEEVFAVAKNRILVNVEIKSEAVARGIVDHVCNEIRAHDMVHQVVVSSFSPRALVEMHSIAPEIRTAVLYNTELYKGRKAVEIVSGLEASVFNIKHQRLTGTLLRRCRENRIPVGVYTVNEPDRMRRLIARGVNAIFTDYPDRLLEVLSRGPSDPYSGSPVATAQSP
jgi:glycerophosphoryl diester phosphodiesterase